jgi:hypothetical protein
MSDRIVGEFAFSCENRPSCGAYGIPQALPSSKMACVGPDWQTKAATQIRWGLHLRFAVRRPVA